MQRRQTNLTIGFDALWRRQSAFDVPNVGSNLTFAFPATSHDMLDRDETTEEILDCTGEDFLFELLTKQIARLTIQMDVDPDILAGLTAFAYAVAANPSGGTNEVQTLAITATGGTFTLSVEVGANAQTTAPIAFDAAHATIQTALQGLSNVGSGQLLVTDEGDPGTFLITAAGTFAKQNIRPIIVNTYALTGGTATIVESTPGVGQLHAISRTTGYSLPLMTLYIGYRGSDKQPLIWKNVVVASIRCQSSPGEKVTATIELVGTVPTDYATAYTMPPCLDIIPIRFGECQMGVAGVDYIGQNAGRGFEYYFQNNPAPFYDGPGVDPTRIERANRRPVGFSFWILGEINDSLYNLFKAKPSLQVYLQLGPTGRSVRYTAPNGYCKLSPQGDGIRHAGDPAESEIAMICIPRKTSGDATTPTNVVAYSKQSSTFLTSA